MKKHVVAFIVCGMLASTFAAEPLWKSGSVRANWFRADITCKVGTLLSGYGQNDVSVEKLDDLEACGLCIDDGERKVVMVSFDLLGMDRDLISLIRQELARIIGTTEARVLLSCTHTHGGPNTRPGLARDASNTRRTLSDEPYVLTMTNAVYAAARDMMAQKDWKICRIGFYSSQVDENRNRRYTTPENCTAAAEYRRMLLDINKGIADKELGLIVLFGFGRCRLCASAFSLRQLKQAIPIPTTLTRPCSTCQAAISRLSGPVSSNKTA